MEREPPEVARRLMRACRSLTYNRDLQPLIEERIERAEGTLRGHLLAKDVTSVRLGPYQVEIRAEGSIELEQIDVDGWQQMPLPQEAAREQSEVSIKGSKAGATKTGVDSSQARYQDQPGQELEVQTYERTR
jgi:hypothetical protein